MIIQFAKRSSMVEEPGEIYQVPISSALVRNGDAAATEWNRCAGPRRPGASLSPERDPELHVDDARRTEAAIVAATANASAVPSSDAALC